MKKIILCLGVIFNSYASEDPAFVTPNTVAVFNAIKTIHGMARTTRDEVRSDGIRLSLGLDGWPEPWYGAEQAKQGLYLVAETYPEHLITPWGEVKVYGGGSYPGDADMAKIFNRFKERLDLKFVVNTGEKSEKGCRTHGYDQAKVHFYKNNRTNEIPESELDRYRGTDTRILANYCGLGSLYEITAIDGIKLPQPERLPIRESRKVAECETEWIRLESALKK